MLRTNVIITALILLVATNVFAFTGWQTGTHEGTPGLQFRLIAGSTTDVEVRRNTADAAHMVIPSAVTINEVSYTVTRITGTGFSSFNTMTSVEIPNTITSIGNSAFSESSGLTSVTIPSGVTEIGERAFSNCTSLTSITFQTPSSLTAISRSTFFGCSALISVDIPYGVTEIGHWAFRMNPHTHANNTSLVSVTIPRTVTSIGEFAFLNCSALPRIEIPISVTRIMLSAFGGCHSLTIYAEAPSRPAGWTSWNPNDRPVVWGYTIVSDEDMVEMPITTALMGNFPNPFNPTTAIAFTLSNTENVEIDVFNVRGQLVRNLVNEVYDAGSYSVVWNGRDDAGNSVASGVYFYRMRAGEYVNIRRMMMLK